MWTNDVGFRGFQTQKGIILLILVLLPLLAIVVPFIPLRIWEQPIAIGASAYYFIVGIISASYSSNHRVSILPGVFVFLADIVADVVCFFLVKASLHLNFASQLPFRLYGGLIICFPMKLTYMWVETFRMSAWTNVLFCGICSAGIVLVLFLAGVEFYRYIIRSKQNVI